MDRSATNDYEYICIGNDDQYMTSDIYDQKLKPDIKKIPDNYAKINYKIIEEKDKKISKRLKSLAIIIGPFFFFFLLE